MGPLGATSFITLGEGAATGAGGAGGAGCTIAARTRDGGDAGDGSSLGRVRVAVDSLGGREGTGKGARLASLPARALGFWRPVRFTRGFASDRDARFDRVATGLCADGAEVAAAGPRGTAGGAVEEMTGGGSRVAAPSIASQPLAATTAAKPAKAIHFTSRERVGAPVGGGTAAAFTFHGGGDSGDGDSGTAEKTDASGG